MQVLSADAAAKVVPRPAATTLILRDAAAGLEVLMVRRSPHASFMPGAYVFPGGAVDAEDASPATQAVCDESADALAARIGAVTRVGDQALAYAVAALRECFEECGLWLIAVNSAVHADWAGLRARVHAGESLASVASSERLALATRALQPWSHWVTPFGLAKRFDTLFFVVQAPPGQTPEVDAGETTTLAWAHPPAALAAHARGEFPMEFATVSTIESLRPFAAGSVATLLAHAAAQADLPALHPRLNLDAQRRIVGVLLPGQAGYESALASP
jgi:8-oxo-dGTP pyrophosphatase MutT (NUDIX family)